MNRLPPYAAALIAAVTLPPLAVARPAREPAEWDAAAAARYMDQRADWWLHGMGAIDHGTACVSCHTALPYALARSSMRTALGERAISPPERQLLDSVLKRVRQPGEMKPFLGGGDPSRGTEAVSNVLVLTAYMHDGSWADMHQALGTLWERQIKTGDRAGAWSWFGDGGGGEEPWEAFDSQYWGATLAAIAIGALPQEYTLSPDVRQHVDLLKQYLRREAPRQSLLNRVSLLWASTKLPDLLTRGEQAVIVREVLARQHADGGWSSGEMVAAGWKRFDGSPQESASDGYGTGLTTVVLGQLWSSGTVPASAKLAWQAGREWLVRNQDRAGGFWPSRSLNKRRDPASDVGKFMTDAATAYCVLALTAQPASSQAAALHTW